MEPFGTHTPYGSLLAQYRGVGSIATADDTFHGEFECSQMHDGGCILLARKLTSTSEPGTLRFPFPDIERFEGVIDDGRRIESSGRIHQINALGLDEDQDPFDVIAFRLRSFVVHADGQGPPVEVRYGISNFFFSGSGKRLDDGVRAIPIELTTHDAAISGMLIPAPEQHDLRVHVMTTRSIAVAAEFVSRRDNNPAEEDLDIYNEAVTDLVFVLSVARGTKIQWLYRATYDRERHLISCEHRDHVTRPYSPHAPIPHHWSAERQAGFIETGYQAFSQNRERYRLRAVVDGYIEAKTEGDFIETRALKLAVALEALKHSFASDRGWRAELFVEERQFKKLAPKLRKAIRQVLLDAGVAPETVNGIAKAGNDGALNRRTFAEIVSDLATDLGLTIKKEDMTAFARSRNTLVHQGRFYASVANQGSLDRMPYGTPHQEYLSDMAFLDRIILRLLGYEGEFLDARYIQEERVLNMQQFLRAGTGEAKVGPPQ